jgi:hypothetical protein
VGITVSGTAWDVAGGSAANVIGCAAGIVAVIEREAVASSLAGAAVSSM